MLLYSSGRQPFHRQGPVNVQSFSRGPVNVHDSFQNSTRVENIAFMLRHKNTMLWYGEKYHTWLQERIVILKFVQRIFNLHKH